MIDARHHAIADRRSSGCSSRDIRRVHRIVAELSELHHDPEAQRSHLIDSACRLIGAVKGGSVVLADAEPDKEPRYVSMIDNGDALPLLGEHWRWWMAESGSSLLGDPFIAHIASARSARGLIRIDGVIGPEGWRNSPVFEYVAGPCGVGDVATWWFRRESSVVTISMLRHRTDRLFTPRDAALLTLLGREIELAYRAESWSWAPTDRSVLPRRHREIVTLMISGHAPAAIAQRLGLKRSTVYTYAKEIYRRYGVASRAELIAKVTGRSADDATPIVTVPASARAPGRART